MNSESKSERVLLLDESRGIYIPQKFITNFNTAIWNISHDDADALLAGPDFLEYWDTWEKVLREAYLIDKDGKRWTLEQDGDLFAVPELKGE